MRLTVLDHHEEVVSVEGKGSVVLPAILFMRDVTNTVQTPLLARPLSRTGLYLSIGQVSRIILANVGTNRRDTGNTRQASVTDSTAPNTGRSNRVGSGKKSVS